ncbi:hypothetical protein WJX73_007915 [Symbiochloris irregularis]|uniref:Uncharacterized protein n=1 Tax=Symbiochloris irregularis TaxID=706552 RepID=A0AAW1PM64_9CHLO
MLRQRLQPLHATDRGGLLLRTQSGAGAHIASPSSLAPCLISKKASATEGSPLLLGALSVRGVLLTSQLSLFGKEQC